MWFCFGNAAFRASRRDIAAGLILGALVPVGWYATGVIGYDEFEPLPLTSYTFVAPAGNAIQYLINLESHDLIMAMRPTSGESPFTRGEAVWISFGPQAVVFLRGV